MVLLEMLWSDIHPLVAEIISMVWHNVRERQVRVDWSEEYDMLPMYLLCSLSLDLNN